jgi:hypothetical protein
MKLPIEFVWEANTDSRLDGQTVKIRIGDPYSSPPHRFPAGA